MGSLANNTSVAIPPWVSPPLDAWIDHRIKVIVLFTFYITCFLIGQSVNWACLLNINKTNLNQSARFLMMTQCLMNTAYVTVNIPYKASVLYLQKTFLPTPLKIFCGWLHLFVAFGSMFLQVRFGQVEGPKRIVKNVVLKCHSIVQKCFSRCTVDQYNWNICNIGIGTPTHQYNWNTFDNIGTTTVVQNSFQLSNRSNCEHQNVHKT